jgi:hypothetical protein
MESDFAKDALIYNKHNRMLVGLFLIEEWVEDYPYFLFQMHNLWQKLVPLVHPCIN